MSETIDYAAVTRAIREYNAAQNSLGRAYDRLMAAIPQGLIVLHKSTVPNPKHDGYYWCYQVATVVGREEPSLIWGSGRASDFGTPAVIIEAPPPKAEFLPELPQ